MAADVWRYLFYAVANGQPGYTTETFLFALPLNQVSFTSKLDAAGSLTATVQTSDPGVMQAMIDQPSWDVLCGRTAIYVELNGSIVWGGMLVTSLYQQSKHQVSIGAVDWWGYFNQRLILWTYTYTSVDQLSIVADLMTVASGGIGPTSGLVGPPGSAIGLIVPAAGTSGTLLTITYTNTDFKQVSQAVTEMASGATGFDWAIDVYYSAGVPTKQLNVSYPRRGRTQQQQEMSGTGITFMLSGLSHQDYVWPADATLQAVTTVGSGQSASGSLTSEASYPDLITEGWPLTEDAISYIDIDTQTLLDNVTASYSQSVKLPVTLPQIMYNVGANSDQPIGSYMLGDDARIIISPDDYFLKGYDSESSGGQWWRIIQEQVNVTDEGLPVATLTFAAPPVFYGGD